MNLSRNSTGLFRRTIFALCIGFFLILLVLSALNQANPLNTTLERDSGMFLYISSSFSKGGLPFITAWDNKPPGIFFINGIALDIGMGTRWGVWLMELLFLSTSTMLGYHLLRKQFGLAPALIGTTVWILGLNRILGGGNFTEEYSLPFGFASLLLWITSEDKRNTAGRDLGIGFCTGCAVLLRPNNIGVQAAIVVTMIAFGIKDGQYRKLILRLVTIGIAAFIPLLFAGLFFASRGAFNEFMQASLLYNLFYTGGNLDPRSSLMGGITGLGFEGGIAFAGYILAVSRIRIQKEHSSSDLFVTWIAINGVIEVILSGLSGKSYWHYFISWLPVVAASSAYLASRSLSEFCLWSEKHPIRLGVSALLLGLLLFFQVPKEYIRTIDFLRTQREKGIQRADPIAQYIDAHTTSADTVLVWGGQVGINFLSKRESPTPYIFYPLFEPSPFTEHFSAEYFRALRQETPVLIVDGSSFDRGKIVPLDEEDPIRWTVEHGIYANPYLSEVLTFIRQNYSLEKVINEVSIYRRKS